MAKERWLITGASGLLGSHVVRQLAAEAAGHTILALIGGNRVGTEGIEVRRISLADLGAVRGCVTDFKPTHVLHLGAMTAVADCHARPAEAQIVNTAATRVLAGAAAAVGVRARSEPERQRGAAATEAGARARAGARAEARGTPRGARFLFASTDMVFGGDAAPYRESDPPAPLSHYGRTKAAAERLLLDAGEALVVRLPLLYGFPRNRRQTTFVGQIAALRAGEPLPLFADEFRTPVWVADAARAVIALARSKRTGMIHVTGPERLSRYDLIARCAEVLGIASPNLVPISRLDVPAAEPRPEDLSLDGSLFAELFPTLTPGRVRPEALVEG